MASLKRMSNILVTAVHGFDRRCKQWGKKTIADILFGFIFAQNISTGTLLEAQLLTLISLSCISSTIT